jgi:hypothetical protein
MTATLLTAGIACFIAAIAGGGLKAFGIEIPALNSRLRQAALGGVGVALFSAGILLEYLPSVHNVKQRSEPETASNAEDSRSVDRADCLQRHFRSLPKDRVSTIEAGTKAYQVIAPQQSKEESIILIFKENRRAIGAVTFQFYSDGNFFKIESVIDSDCHPVHAYSNATRNGDKNVLQNWDDLQVRLGGLDYLLHFDYAEGRIAVDFIRIAR